MLPPVIEADHVGHTWLLISVYGFGVLGFATLIAIALWRMMHYAKLAEEAETAASKDSELSVGPAIVIGIVEQSRESEETVTIEVEQKGSESESSGTWSHAWKEVDRRVRVAPFYLRRPSGERVRIEPTKKVFLIDDMDGCILVNTSRRVRIATLTPGEEIIAKGVLRQDYDPEGMSSAYRSLPSGWVLSAPSSKTPLFLSSEPLGARFQKTRRFHYKSAIYLFLLFVLMQVLNTADHARVALGTSEQAIVIDRHSHRTVDEDDKITTHYVIQSSPPGRDVFSAEVSILAYRTYQEGMKIPIVHDGGYYMQYGTRPTLHLAYLLLSMGILLVTCIAYGYLLAKRKPWYAGEVNDTDSGRLDPKTGIIKEQGLALSDHDQGYE